MMNNSKARTVIAIDNLDRKTGEIKYSIVEFYTEDPLKIVLKSKYTPIAGQRLFIYPDSNIPRFKLKGFCDKHKVSVAKAKETANVFFMHSDTFNKEQEYYSTPYAYSMAFMYKDYFIKYLKKATKVDDLKYLNLITDLTNNNESIVIIKDHWSFSDHGLNNHKLKIVEPDDDDEDNNGKPSKPNCELPPDQIYLVSSDQRKNLDTIISKDCYHSDALLTILNEGGAVIDAAMYEGIKNLFESKDPNDHKVAMEAMANCDYRKSAVYLLMIFYAYQNDIYNCDTKTHVNFKSFLKFFSLSASRSIDIDDVMERLRDKRLLTTANLKVVMQEAQRLMNESTESITKHFVPTGIVPVEEIQQEAIETDEREQPQPQPVQDSMPEPQISDL